MHKTCQKHLSAEILGLETIHALFNFGAVKQPRFNGIKFHVLGKFFYRVIGYNLKKNCPVWVLRNKKN